MRTINLLPKVRQQEVRYEAILRGLWVFLALSLLSFGLVFIVQLGTRIYLQAKQSSIKAEIVGLQKLVNKKENADLKKKIQDLNSIIADYNALGASSPKWSKVIKAFAVLPPQEIKINSFSVEASKKMVTITGYSSTREAVIQLYNNILQDEENFYNIDYPLENVAKPKNVVFHFSFFAQDKLLQ